MKRRGLLDTGGLVDRFATGRGFAAVLAVYIVLHFALRLALSPTIGVDDVAETIFAQSLQWTYDPRQPPLYTWLLWATFHVFGVGVASVALLKYALVAAGYVCVWLSACRIFLDRRLALLAVLSLSLIYAVGYGVHVGFTNTVLLFAACGATLYALLLVVERGGVVDYLALGAALGIGLLSKWGYAVFAAPLVIAALLQEESRRRLADPRIVATFAVAAAFVGPFLLLGFQGGTMNGVFTGAMREGGHASYLAGVGSGLGSLFVAVTMFLAPLWLFAVTIFPNALRAPRRAAGVFDARRLFEHFFVVVAGVLLLGVFVAGITHFKSRWMHPALIVFPLYYFCLVRDAGYSPRQLQGWAALVAVAAAAVIGARLAQDLVGPPFCGKCRLLKPYAELARVIESQGFSGGTIVAGDEHIAGNFRAVFPESRAATSVYPFYIPPLPPDGNGQCLVVWEQGEGDGIPPALRQFLQAGFDAEPGFAPIQTIEVPYRRGDPRRLTLDFIRLPGTGRCR